MVYIIFIFDMCMSTTHQKESCLNDDLWRSVDSAFVAGAQVITSTIIPTIGWWEDGRVVNIYWITVFWSSQRVVSTGLLSITLYCIIKFTQNWNARSSGRCVFHVIQSFDPLFGGHDSPLKESLISPSQKGHVRRIANKSSVHWGFKEWHRIKWRVVSPNQSNH